LEESAEDRNIADEWNLLEIFGFAIIQKTADHVRLTLREFDFRLDATDGQCRNHRTTDIHCVAVVEGANFGSDLKADGATIRDCRYEREQNTVLLVLNRDGSGSAPGCT